MEELIRSGTPQRTAHEIVGKLVRTAMDKGVRLADLPADELKAAHASLDGSVKKVLGVENAVARFVSYGSTGPKEVERQIELWQKRLKAEAAGSRRNRRQKANVRRRKNHDQASSIGFGHGRLGDFHHRGG